MNKAILIGRLGKDPEVRMLDNGTAVASFSLATSNHYKDKTTGEKKEVTDWHNIVAWKGLADIAARYLKKGNQVCIEGAIKTRSWEKDGVTRYTTEIIASNLTMLGSKNEAQQHAEPSSQTGSDGSTDDLPF